MKLHTTTSSTVSNTASSCNQPADNLKSDRVVMCTSFHDKAEGIASLLWSAYSVADDCDARANEVRRVANALDTHLKLDAAAFFRDAMQDPASHFKGEYGLGELKDAAQGEDKHVHKVCAGSTWNLTQEERDYFTNLHGVPWLPDTLRGGLDGDATVVRVCDWQQHSHPADLRHMFAEA